MIELRFTGVFSSWTFSRHSVKERAAFLKASGVLIPSGKPLVMN